MSMIDEAAHAATADSVARPVQEVNGQPESSCEPRPELATEAKPAADGLPAAMPVEAEAGAGAESNAVASGTNPEMKPRGRPFEPGQSGNPAGRPKGARNHITRAVEELIDDQAERLAAKAIEKALAGDAGMLRVLLSRIVPTQRARTVEFELPSLETAADARAASAAVLAACSRAEISPAEADAIMTLIAKHVRIIEAADFEAKVSALENEPQK